MTDSLESLKSALVGDLFSFRLSVTDSKVKIALNIHKDERFLRYTVGKEPEK